MANINPQPAITNQRNNSIVKYTKNSHDIIPFQENYCKAVSKNELNNLVFPYEANYIQNSQARYSSKVVVDRDITYILRFYIKKDSFENPVQGKEISVGILNSKCKYGQYYRDEFKNITIQVPLAEVGQEFEMRVCLKRYFLQVSDSSENYQKIDMLRNIHEGINLVLFIQTNGNELTLIYYEELNHFVLK